MSRKDCQKKKRPKTRIFACLCPCSVLEYVDADSAMKKKNDKNGDKCDPGKKDIFMDIPPMPRDGGKQPGMMMPRSPCRDGPRGMMNPMQGGFLGRGGPQRPTGGDTFLNKPLKIVFEEVDCSKMDFSQCNKQPSGGDCSPCRPMQQQCPAQQQRCMPAALQRCLPPNCPLPPCPKPCMPAPSACGQMVQQCPPCPGQDNAPPVTQRMEIRLNQQGQLVEQCTPIGSPSILNVGRDESCPMERTIKITYCGKGTDPGQKGDDEGQKTKDSKDGEDKSKASKKSEGKKDSKEEGEGEADDEGGDDEGKEKKSDEDVDVHMALGPYLEKSNESLQRILAANLTESTLRELSKTPPVSYNVTEELDSFSRMLSSQPSELSVRHSRENSPQKQTALQKKHHAKTNIICRKTLVEKTGASNAITFKDTRILPKKPNTVHRLMGQPGREIVQSTVQMRTKRVFCSSVKALQYPTGAKSFKETTV